MHIHGAHFIYKDTKIFNRLREWYVVARYGHWSKIEGDLAYLDLVPMAVSSVLSLFIFNILSLTLHLKTLSTQMKRLRH